MIIGLIGRMGSGKTTVSKILNEQKGFTKFKFASVIKSMVSALGLTHEQVEGKEKNTPIPYLGDKTPRFIMQTLGTEWGRDIITKGIWANMLIHKIGNKYTYNALAMNRVSIVIDDVRFMNEYEALVKLPLVYFWRIKREEEEEEPDHASEGELDEETTLVTIQNNGDLDNLTDQVTEALQKTQAICGNIMH